MTPLTYSSLQEALNRALKTLAQDHSVLSSAQSAGFIIPIGSSQAKGYRHGYQVLVKVHRFNEELLLSNPDSGGLLG